MKQPTHTTKRRCTLPISCIYLLFDIYTLICTLSCVCAIGWSILAICRGCRNIWTGYRDPPRIPILASLGRPVMISIDNVLLYPDLSACSSLCYIKGRVSRPADGYVDPSPALLSVTSSARHPNFRERSRIRSFSTRLELILSPPSARDLHLSYISRLP